MILPTRRFALAVAATAPIWAIPGSLGPAAAEAALLLLVVLALSDFVRLPPKDAVRISRAAPASVGIGEEFEIEYELASAWPHQINIHLAESLPDGLADPSWQEVEAVIPPGGTVAKNVRVTAARRSHYELRLVAMRVMAPLGLLQRLSRHSLESGITVAPSLTIAGRYRMLALQHRLQLAGLHRMRQRGSGMAFSNLREYVRGDDPRLVDWKQTARRQKLITRARGRKRCKPFVNRSSTSCRR